MVLGEVFAAPVHSLPQGGLVTLLEEIQAEVEFKIAPLDDVTLTGIDKSSAEVLGIPAAVLAEQLSRNLLQEIIDSGAGGGALAPLANQLSHDRTYLQGQRIEGLLSNVLGGLSELRTGPQEAAHEAATFLIGFDDSCRRAGTSSEILGWLLTRAADEGGYSERQINEFRIRVGERGLDPRVLIPRMPQHQEAVRRWLGPLTMGDPREQDQSTDSGALLAWLTQMLRDELSRQRFGDLSTGCRYFLAGALSGHAEALQTDFVRRLYEHLPPLRSTSREAVLVRSTADRSPVVRIPQDSGEQHRIKLSSIARQMCNLPPVDPYTTGRDAIVDKVAEAIKAAIARYGAATGFLSGQPGVGTSTVAIEVARMLASAFPGGAVYIDLRGLMPGSRRDARTTVRIVSEALGLDLAPASEGDDRLFTSFSAQLTSRKVLLILDNARDAAHVSPLTRAPAACGIIVTSRDRIQNFADPGLIFEVESLTRDAAVQVLSKYIGDRPCDAQLLGQLANLCADLPLALRMIGARIASRPDLDITYLVHLLRAEATRLDYLEAGDRAVRAAIKLSYDNLDEPTRHVLRMSSAAPGSVVTGADISHSLNEAVADQELLLNRIADRSLARQTVLQSPTEGVTASFALHDLVRLFASERRRAEESQADIREFCHRFVDRLCGQLTDINNQSAGAEFTGELDPARFHAAERMAEAEKWLDLATDLAIGLHILYSVRKELDSLIEITEVRIRIHLLDGRPDLAVRACLINADDIREMKAAAQALAAAQRARQIAKENGLAMEAAEAGFKISVIMGDLKDWRGALQAGVQAVTEITALGRESAAVGAAINNCIFASLKDDRVAALEWGRKAVDLAARWGNSGQKAFAADEYGRAQRRYGDYTASIEFHQKARMLWEAEGHWWNAATSCLDAAMAADSARDVTVAAHMLDNAAKYWKRGAYLPQLLEALIDLSALHVRSSSLKQAAEALDRTRMIADESPEPPPLMVNEIQVRQQVVRVLLGIVPEAGADRLPDHSSLHDVQEDESADSVDKKVIKKLQRYFAGDTDAKAELRFYIGLPTWNEPERIPMWLHEEFPVDTGGKRAIPDDEHRAALS